AAPAPPATSSTTAATVTRPRSATTSPAAATARKRARTSGTAFSSAGHCAVLRSLGAKISQSVPPTLKVSRTNVEAETAALRSLADVAPAEIRSAFRTYVDAFSRYMGAYASIGLRPGKALTHAQYLQV